MKKTVKNQFQRNAFEKLMNRLGLRLQGQLIVVLLLEKILPLALMIWIAASQINSLGSVLRSIAVGDSSEALNKSAVENIERMTTDTAQKVAAFLYGRDNDILYLAGLEPSYENYLNFIQTKSGRVQVPEEYVLNEQGSAWVSTASERQADLGGISENEENNDMDGFHYRSDDGFTYAQIPLYDEITFVDLQGMEQVKVVAANSPKSNYPLSTLPRNVSKRENTYVKAETYFEKLQNLKPGDIYVSDVIGAYVGSNYIGMYAPQAVEAAAAQRGYDIPYEPEKQAYAGMENPNGERFEGIVRFATPVENAAGEIIGFVTFALNHDHIREFVDHITPMAERYTNLPSAFDGNYAFIWDYQCRSICHPRHHSIVGVDPETGVAQVPWLEASIYDAWQASGNASWVDFVKDWPLFDNQSRKKAPAAALTKMGLVGLDGRYLNNAPQCTGWMDLTKTGGSGSFYILWSGLYKLTTAAAIPYYTGQYAPSESNGFSKRGFGIVTIGAGLEDFTAPATQTEERLETAINENMASTTAQLGAAAVGIMALLALIALMVASLITGNIKRLIKGVSRVRKGERQFRFNDPLKDEFAMLADSFDELTDSVVSSVHNPQIITDMQHKVIYANDLALMLSGRSLDDMVGTDYGDTSIYPRNTGYDPIMALENGTEAEIYYDKANDKYFKGKASYLVSKAGEQVGFIIETQDVTDMVLSQMELEKAVEAANAANAHKGDFLARMSHEIRTPMNAIIGLTGIVEKKLEEPQVNREQIGENVHQIGQSSQHLLGLLNDILDISTIEAGKIELADDAMDLAALIETVDVMIRSRCEEKSIQFVIDSTLQKPATFKGDALRLRQVLINLLGNAVKFTPTKGTITLKVKPIHENSEEATIQFVVADTGIGIKADRLESIFSPFEQAEKNTAVRYGGTGLGLSISKSIVELFGGELKVESVVGEKSEFSFEITLKKDSFEALAARRECYDGLFESKRMLLVDDVEINRMIVIAMLEKTGIEIEEAEDGLKAVEKVQSAPPGHYDVILMDISMPNMDGYQASEVIRKMERPDAKVVPIIALTANAFKQDRERAHAAGMTDHISKPVDVQELLKSLDQYLLNKKA